MFWLKKLIAVLTSPLVLLFLILAIGFLLAWRERAGLWPRRLIVASSLGLLLISMGPTGELLLTPLENHHPVITDLHSLDGATHIVVLGGGYTARPDGPVTSALATSSTIRLTEGLRLHHLLENTTLIVSGASIHQPGSTAEAMAELAADLGVAKDRIITAELARDTAEEAAAVNNIISTGDRVILVTSASHMPRAMTIFARAGIDAIAAPTDHLTSQRPFYTASPWPSAHNVRMVERAVYEYIALIWVSVGGS